MSNFSKITPTCSNVFLIDQNLCLKNTLNTINYNFSSIDTSVYNLEQYNQVWYDLYTVFTSFSSKWIRTATNIQTFSAKWIDTTTTVKNLSSGWSKPFTLYHTTMKDISAWYDMSVNDRNAYGKAFVDLNFDSKKYPPNQIIDLVIYLNQNLPFTFSYDRNYYETCIPNGGGLTLSCNSCGLPNHGCNRHHGKGKKKVNYCFNAYTACSVSHNAASSTVTCEGAGGRNLHIGLARNAADINVARTYLIRFQNINKTWTAL